MINGFHLPTFITGICTGWQKLACASNQSSHQIHPSPDKHITTNNKSDESSQFLAEHGNQRVAEILLPTSCPNTKFMTLFLMLRNAQKRAKQDAFFVRPDIAFVIGEFRRESQFDLITSCHRSGGSVFFSSPQIVFIFHPLAGEMG